MATDANARPAGRMPGLAWDRPCLVCGLEVPEESQSPDFRLPMHEDCVPEYRERASEIARDAARERHPS